MTRHGATVLVVLLAGAGCSYPGYWGFADQQAADGGTDASLETGTEGSAGSSGCVADPDCAASGKAACNTATHLCVDCMGDGHCQDGTNVRCDTTAHVCVPCLQDADCPGAHCDTVAHGCVQCLENKHCTEASAAFCETTQHKCVACTADDSSQCKAPTPRCDTTQNACVACLPEQDNCPGGKYCSTTGTCQNGCKKDGDCNTWDAGVTFYCDVGDAGTGTHRCKGCTLDEHCLPGYVCSTGSECVPGCTLPDESGPGHACDPESTVPDCCGGQCTNLVLGDVDNCGSCGNPCGANPAHAAWKCAGGKCDVDCTELGYANCDHDPANGCEADTRTDNDNCGQCTNHCTGGTTCADSKCQ